MKKLLLFLFLFFPISVKGIETSARSAILMDLDSNRILYEKNIHEIRSVASISKIMTAVVAIESGHIVRDEFGQYDLDEASDFTEEVVDDE